MSDLETYLLLLLSDSNLPTGGFVASSGLESYHQHGYISTSSSSQLDNLISFIHKSLHSYSRLNSPIFINAFNSVQQLSTSTVDQVYQRLQRLDQLCESMTQLNHVTKRASIAQGTAFLSLYHRAFSPPPPPPLTTTDDDPTPPPVVRLIEKVREGIKDDKQSWKGHQSVAWGIVLSAIGGLSLAKSHHLFLFLQSRSLLSSAIRLNLIGPYLAHRVLLWKVREVVEGFVVVEGEVERGKEEEEEQEMGEEEEEEEEDWWDLDPEWKFLSNDTTRTTESFDQEYDHYHETEQDQQQQPTIPNQRRKRHVTTSLEQELQVEPVTTWPLGEIVASRHDQLFTKVFNS